MTAAFREYQRGTALINQAKNYGRVHPGATQEDTLVALGEQVTDDNSLYARTGLFLAVQERESTANGGLTQAPVGEEGNRRWAP